MGRVKFYSKYDMACNIELDKLIERINDHSIDKEWSFSDVIEFHNILKYLQVEQFSKYLIEQTGFNHDSYVKKANAKIGKYIGKNKSIIVDKFHEINLDNIDDYFEIFEKYSIYKNVSDPDFKSLIDKEQFNILKVLKCKKVVNYFDNIIKNKIISDPTNASIIISIYLDNGNLHLPPSLTEEEMLSLIDKYIDSDAVNINVLRKIIHFPAKKKLHITDKIKLHAKRKEKEETDRIFSQETAIESVVSIKYETDLEKAILSNADGEEISFVVNLDWIKDNKDYPTLWNNFIHLFGIVDNTMRSTVVSKTHDMSTFESLFSPTGDHLYTKSLAFNIRG